MYRYVQLCIRDEKKEVNQFPDLKAFGKSAWLLLTTQFCVLRLKRVVNPYVSWGSFCVGEIRQNEVNMPL